MCKEPTRECWQCKCTLCGPKKLTWKLKQGEESTHVQVESWEKVPGKRKDGTAKEDLRRVFTPMTITAAMDKLVELLPGQS